MSKQIWLMEMKYITSVAGVNDMICFDFDFLFETAYQHELERQEKERQESKSHRH